MTRFSYLHVTMVIPLLGIVSMLARSEYRASDSKTWRIEIVGYDPRDLIHGHYLRYNYVLSLTNPISPHSEEQTRKSLNRLNEDDRGQFVCFSKPAGTTIIMQLKQESLSQYACDSLVRIENLAGPKKYLIPEVSAAQLDVALTTQKSSVDLIIDSEGGVMVGDLYLEGRPWREVIPKSE